VNWLVPLIEAIGPYALGFAGIGGTIWGVRHQTKSAEVSSLLAEKRKAYGEFLAIVTEAETKLNTDFQTVKAQDIVILRDNAARAAGKCRLLGEFHADEKTRDVIECITRAIALIENDQRLRLPMAASDIRISLISFSMSATQDAKLSEAPMDTQETPSIEKTTRKNRRT